MTSARTITALTSLIAIGLCSAAFCAQVIHPWNATTAIVKAGDAFDVWFDADPGQTVGSVVLRGPHNSVSIPSPVVRTGSWTYDRISTNSYNTRVTVTVPAGTPEDRYDLCLVTSTGDELSKRAVKVIRQYRTDYDIMHISDTHMCQGAKINGHPERLLKVSTLADIANIIGPEMVFVTGDLINNNMFPPHERSRFFYEGCARTGLKGMQGFDAATFSVVGNHDFMEGDEPGAGMYPQKARFWNRHHGLQDHRFSYGNTRCMIINDGWNGFNWAYQLKDHASWLDDVGAGNLRLAAYHKSEMGIMGAWAKTVDLGLAMIGHNHHLAGENPYELGRRPIQYYANSLREHFSFNLFRIKARGSYGIVNNIDAVRNPKDPPSKWKPRLTLAYAKANDGSCRTNSATLVNKFDVGFPRARIRFVMPKGAAYTVSQGTVTQAFDGDSVHVVDVLAAIEANSKTTVKISPSATR